MTEFDPQLSGQDKQPVTEIPDETPADTPVTAEPKAEEAGTSPEEEAGIPYAGPPSEPEPADWRKTPYLPPKQTRRPFISIQRVHIENTPSPDSYEPKKDFNPSNDPAQAKNTGINLYRSKLATASFFVGALSAIACCIPFLQLPLAVAAIVLVILHYRKYHYLNGYSIAGGILGITSLISSYFMTLYWGQIFSMMHDPEFLQNYQSVIEQLRK